MALLKLLMVQINISNFGQSSSNKWTNQKGESNIRTHIQYTIFNYHEDDGIDLLPLVEFVYNYTYHSSFGRIPFFCKFWIIP